MVHISERRPADRSRLLPELRSMLEAADAEKAAPMHELSASEARRQAEIQIPALWGDSDEVQATEDLAIPVAAGDIKARLYRWRDSADIILFFHGGGWVLGSVETHDGAVRALARSAAANVLSVEYRKAPEAPYPAAIDDAEAALRWLCAIGPSKGLSVDRIIVAGDSAGATISAVLALRAREEHISLAGQVLIYPATDLGGRSESRALFASGFFLDQKTMDWYVGHYLSGGANPNDPGVSPLHAADLSGLAPALLVTADHDPLRDEGRAYAQRLIAAGNDVCYEEWRGVTHGFFNMDRNTPQARLLSARIGSWVNQIWSRR